MQPPIRATDTSLLRDGRAADITHVSKFDAAMVVSYLQDVCGETDFLTFGPGEFGMTIEEEEAFILKMYTDRTGFLLKATVEDQIVALAGVQRSKRLRIQHVGELGVTVRRKFWNLGLGRTLCLKAIEEAQAMGCSRIELKVRRDNTGAVHLYESLGFVVEGVIRGGFRANGMYYDELLMSILSA